MLLKIYILQEFSIMALKNVTIKVVINWLIPTENN